MEDFPSYVQIGGMYARPGEKAFGYLRASTPAGGVEMPVVIANGEGDGPRLALIGGIHGCEYAGIEAVVSVMRELDPGTLSGVVLSVNVVNVPAFIQRTAYVCPLDGKNLGRVFPGDPAGSATETIADVLQREIIGQSDYVIELHGGDIVEDLVPFIICNRTGNDEVDRQTLALAKSYGLSRILQAPSWDGRFTNEGALYATACEAGKPAILTEAGANGLVNAEAVNVHTDGIKSAMRHLGMLSGVPIEVPDQRVTSRLVSMRAPLSGMLRLRVAAGDTVAEGDVVAEISDYFGNPLEDVRVPIGGTVTFVVTSLSIQSGEALMGIADFSVGS